MLNVTQIKVRKWCSVCVELVFKTLIKETYNCVRWNFKDKRELLVYKENIHLLFVKDLGPNSFTDRRDFRGITDSDIQRRSQVTFVYESVYAVLFDETTWSSSSK